MYTFNVGINHCQTWKTLKEESFFVSFGKNKRGIPIVVLNLS